MRLGLNLDEKIIKYYILSHDKELRSKVSQNIKFADSADDALRIACKAYQDHIFGSSNSIEKFESIKNDYLVQVKVFALAESTFYLDLGKKEMAKRKEALANKVNIFLNTYNYSNIETFIFLRKEGR